MGWEKVGTITEVLFKYDVTFWPPGAKAIRRKWVMPLMSLQEVISPLWCLCENLKWTSLYLAGKSQNLLSVAYFNRNMEIKETQNSVRVSHMCSCIVGGVSLIPGIEQSFKNFFFFDFMYLERERERERAVWAGKQKEREADSAECRPPWGAGFHDSKITPQLKSRVGPITNWATQVPLE